MVRFADPRSPTRKRRGELPSLARRSPPISADLGVPLFRLPVPQELRPIEFGPVKFFLHALKSRIPDSPVCPEVHESAPLGLGRCPHDRRVGITGVGGGGYRPRIALRG